MKKAGIVTMVGGDNYGNVLQNYAVQQLLKEQGYEPYTLNNTTKYGFPTGAYAWREVPIWKKLRPSYIDAYIRTTKAYAYGCKNDRDCSGRGFKNAKQNVDAFKLAKERRKANFAVCRAETMNADPRPINRERHDTAMISEYDAFITGSDQVWNPNYWTTSSVDFLQFAPEHKRIALAPSFGISKLPKQRCADFRRWLNSIPHLSVREDAGAKIVKELTGREAKVLLDPTFALTKEQWLSYAKEPKNHPKTDYVFCYFLGNETNRYVRYIENYAKDNNCEIVDVCDIHDLRYYDIEPREFVWLLANAKTVFTDSFHGTAFSINLQIPFVVFERVEGGSSMSSRITSVLKKTGLEHRKFPLDKDVRVDEISFLNAEQVVSHERETTKTYLHEALASAQRENTPKLASHYHCTGCGACFNACKVGALKLCADEEGFCYPKIDASKCIHCNACERACPADQVVPPEETTSAYYAFANDTDICKNSSSGGLFSLLAAEILRQGGTVFGAGFDEKFRVCHQRIDREADIAKLRTSKYVQSDIGLMFREAESLLKEGKTVLFAGTPCQIAALKQYLKQEYFNLYTQDIICHGVPSPGIWKKYLSEVHGGKEIQSISFRDKTLGWNSFSMKVTYQDGSEYRELATKDPYERAFLANLTLRPSCYQCQYKTVARVSDLTLADYWGVETVHPELASQQGVSLVLTHTEKGERLLAAVKKQATVHTTDLERAAKLNHATTHSVRWHRNREAFFEAAETQPLIPLVKKCLKPTLKQQTKSFIYRNGSRVKQLLRKMKGK